MIKARYIHPDERRDTKAVMVALRDGEDNEWEFITRTEAVVLKMQLEEVIKKIDGERK